MVVMSHINCNIPCITGRAELNFISSFPCQFPVTFIYVTPHHDGPQGASGLEGSLTSNLIYEIMQRSEKFFHRFPKMTDSSQLLCLIIFFISFS
jgi:hypothetical protein